MERYPPAETPEDHSPDFAIGVFRLLNGCKGGLTGIERYIFKFLMLQFVESLEL